MRLNSKLTWGLGWIGLALVVAVPSVDFLTGRAGGSAAVLTSTTDPVKTAAVTTTVTPTGITITPTGAAAPADPVNTYLRTNASLPDYISGGTAPGSKSASSAPIQVATIDPTPPVVAPVPFPARPPDSVVPARSVAVAPIIGDSAASQEPAVNDDDIVPPTEEADAGPVPPAPIGSDQPGWRSQSLEQYLSRNGLLDDGGSRSTAQVTTVNGTDPNYDADGFYLSDGPNGARAVRRARVQQLLQDDGSSDDADATLPGFTLF